MSEVALAARVLLEQLRHSGWRDLYVRTPRYSLYIAKQGAPSANPLLRASAQRSPLLEQEILAPHIGTVAWIEAEGAEVSSGATVARLEVLGALIEVTSAFAGQVGPAVAPLGSLLDYGATILRITTQPASSARLTSSSV